MTLTINIACDNSAFDDHKEAEIGRILTEFAERLKTESIVIGDTFHLRDINGNKVGEVIVGD